jgi:hypothetical protein
MLRSNNARNRRVISCIISVFCMYRVGRVTGFVNIVRKLVCSNFAHLSVCLRTPKLQYFSFRTILLHWESILFIASVAPFLRCAIVHVVEGCRADLPLPFRIYGNKFLGLNTGHSVFKLLPPLYVSSGQFRQAWYMGTQQLMNWRESLPFSSESSVSTPNVLIYSLLISSPASFCDIEFHVFVSLTRSLDKHLTVYKTEYDVLAGVGVYVVHSTLTLKLKGCSSLWDCNHQSRYRSCYWKMGFADVYVTWG